MKPSNQKDKIEEKEIATEESTDDGENSENEGAAKKKSYSLKSRILWLFATVIVAAILLLIAVPGFFDNSSLKFKVTQKASEFLNSNLTIGGEVEVALFPFPTITANDVLLQNYKNEGKVYNLFAKSVAIRLSPLKFLSKEFSISKITLSDVILETFLEVNVNSPRQDKFTEIVSQIPASSPTNPSQNAGSNTSSELFAVDKFQPTQFSANSLPKVEIDNGEIISYDKLSRKKEVTDINGKVMIDAKKIRASGKFTTQKINNSFKLTANFNSDSSKQDSTLELTSPAFNLTIHGSFTSENKGIFLSNFEGKADAEIFEIRTFYRDYISNSTAIYDKIKPNSQSIKISSDIKNSSGEISLDNILINSNLINGKGTSVIDFTSDLPKIDVSLDLENLDLDSIWSKERVEVTSKDQPSDLANNSDETVERFVQNLVQTAAENDSNNPTDHKEDNADTSQSKVTAEKKPEELNLRIANKIKNFDLSSEIKIKSVKYLEGEIKDVNLYLTISKEGQILILPMIFSIPGDAVVRVNGVLENTDDLPKFIGKLDVNGKNLGESLKWLQLQSQNLKFDNLKEYIIYSDVMLFPNNITLDDFYLSLNGQSELLGEIKIDSSAKTTNIRNKFQISSLNVDDFFLTSGKNIYLSSGSLLRKLLWLNDIASVTDMEMTFDKLIYKGEVFSDQSSLKLNFGQGYFKITELKMTSDKTNLQGSLSLDISNQNPEFNFNLVANDLHYEATPIEKPSILKDSKSVDDSKETKKNTVADQFFALPSLEGFNGNINILVNNLKLDDLEVKNSKVVGKLKDGIMNDATSSCDIYGGNFNYKGTIGIKGDKILNGVLSLNTASLEKMLPDLIGVKNIKGVSNISANITSIADSKDDFVKTLTSEIKFSAVSPIVNGYGLNDLVNKMFYPAQYQQDLRNPESVIFNQSSKTIFKQATGNISIDKDKGGKFSINLTAPALNGVFSGKIDLAENSIDGLMNIIFITGSRQKQIPLNIATAMKGDMESISISSNLDQVRQYLGLPVLNKAATPPSAPTPSASSTTSAVEANNDAIATPTTANNANPTPNIQNTGTPPTPATNGAPTSKVVFSPAKSPESPIPPARTAKGVAEKQALENFNRQQAERDKNKVIEQVNSAMTNPAAAKNFVDSNPTPNQ